MPIYFLVNWHTNNEQIMQSHKYIAVFKKKPKRLWVVMSLRVKIIQMYDNYVTFLMESR